MKRALVFPFAVVAYVAGLAAFAAMGVLLAGYGSAPPPSTNVATAIAVDVALLAVFGVSHSVMARPAFKARWTRIVSTEAERSVYVLVTGIVVLALVRAWRDTPASLWHVEHPTLRYVLHGVSFAGFAFGVASSFLTNHFELFGLRQAWLCARGRPYEPVPFVEHTLYKRIRHPIMLGFLIWFWATPSMSVGHFVFALGMTIYIAVGVWFEERDLARVHGEPYLAYRRRVPAILPLPTRKDGSG